jgi:hypothetical protein
MRKLAWPSHSSSVFPVAGAAVWACAEVAAPNNIKAASANDKGVLNNRVNMKGLQKSE